MSKPRLRSTRTVCGVVWHFAANIAVSILRAQIEMTFQDIFYEDDVNMGLVPGSGLKSPRYNVDDLPVDKLHLERALDDDSAAEGVTGHRAMA